jgi:hypothetical protein
MANPTWLHGYPCSAGGKVLLIGTYVGPGPGVYVLGSGVTVYAKQLRSMDMVKASSTLSGNYRVQAQPNQVGNAQSWNLRYFNSGNGNEAPSNTDLSAETCSLEITGS